MKKRFISVILMILLSACGVATTPAPAPTTDQLTRAAITTPAWFDVTLTDARTGKTFRINDFKGKVVLLETMAQWCTNCKQQQTQVKAMRDRVGALDDLFLVELDVDPNENVADLKNYVAERGVDWLYAISPAEVSRELGNLYTAQFLNPPSTPILIVDRKGIAHPLPFGIKSADDLEKAVRPYLEEGMSIQNPASPTGESRS